VQYARCIRTELYARSHFAKLAGLFEDLDGIALLGETQRGGQSANAAADDQPVDLLEQGFEDGQLGADLGARHDGDQRPLRLLERAFDERRP